MAMRREVPTGDDVSLFVQWRRIPFPESESNATCRGPRRARPHCVHGQQHAVRALSVAPVLDDELEEEEAGGK
jgi:hypothetical protein